MVGDRANHKLATSPFFFFFFFSLSFSHFTNNEEDSYRVIGKELRAFFFFSPLLQRAA